MKINNALGFAGLLHGWDAETEQQRRRQEEDRVRQNSQDMFGINQALGNLQLGEQQRLGELGQFTQGATLSQLGERQDNSYAGAPLRKATAEYGRMVDSEQLAAKQQLFDQDVVRAIANRNATGKLNRLQNQFVVDDANSEAAKYKALVESMDETNAVNVLEKLQLDKRYEVVNIPSQGVVVRRLGDPTTSIPLTMFKAQVLNHQGATKALESDVANSRVENRATSTANARGGQANNRATFEGLKHLHKTYSDLLSGLNPEDKQHSEYKAKVDRFENLISNGSHQ